MIGPAVVGRDLPAVGPQPPVGPSPRPAAAQEQNELQQQQQQSIQVKERGCTAIVVECVIRIVEP